ncbi:hypothetical protein OD91_0063 [Lutibacter sp. Hel_I_33_5]|uniref:MauE/DoxX family redox-associated membrane protein n=1 Tax=Lutibacter sp. Hel_I_33_5 TaxID=1566289 RepID=UPI0011A346FD|nr:MauE/DoxX family redox-associated membrane protein [Lutibacter sp. Hel_I_33_5]TVZ54827.1 hypothetical protein OD91_0063 [Lutibacter sp. Hel_I_33_5]
MIFNLTNTQKINWVRIIAVVSTLILMLYAPKLWITTKDFPVIPLFDWLPIPKYPLDYILAIFFFGIQVLYIFQNKRWQGWTIIILYVLLALIDQNRLQPYFYQSILTVFAIEIFNKKAEPKKILYAVILIFFATYFWSGVHKLNEIFYQQWMGALLKHFSFLPEWFLQAFTYAVPWLESGVGILLLFNKTRKLGVSLIVIMHLGITVLLFYLGYGYNVVPWNIQNILSVFIIFWTLQTTSWLDFFTMSLDYQKVLVLLFTIILPFSNLLGGWDHLLSFSFFTSKLKYYYIEIDEELEDNLPEHIQRYYRYNNNKPRIYTNEWAGDVNKVLFYPEDRIIKYTEEYLRSFAKNPKKNDLTKKTVYNQ